MVIPLEASRARIIACERCGHVCIGTLWSSLSISLSVGGASAATPLIHCTLRRSRSRAYSSCASLAPLLMSSLHAVMGRGGGGRGALMRVSGARIQIVRQS